MGTSKKLVMASLVSMMLVLAFMIGMVPGQNATTAVNAAGDSVNMGALLDQILGSNVGDDSVADKGGSMSKGGSVAIGIESVIEGIVVKTPEDNSQTPEIPVPLQASIVGGTGTEGITYVANLSNDGTAFPGPGVWSGDSFSGEFFSPFAGALDVGAFVTGVANTTTELALYALANVTQVGTKQTTLLYEAANAPADALVLTIQEVETLIDNDDNAFPDDLFNDIAPGEIWVANILVDGQLRTVLVANLDDGSKGNLGDVFLSPNGNVQVQTPGLADFQAAGVIGAGENGFAIIEVVNDLSVLLDNVDGDASQSARQQWADAANGVAPGTLVAGAQFVEISLVYTTNSGANFAEINDLAGTGLTVDLTLSGLGATTNDLELHSYPTAVGADGSSITNDGSAPQVWTEVDGAIAGGTGLTASLETFSVFAALDVLNVPPLSLNSASPSTVPAGAGATVILTGVIPTATALSVAEAAAAYTVTVGGVAVPFTDALKGGDAITASDFVNPNQAAVAVPGDGSIPGGDQDVVITDNNDSGNTATLVAGLTIGVEHVVTTSVTGPCSGTFALSPTNSTSLTAGGFTTGEVVTVTFTADSGCMLDSLTANGNPIANGASITVDQDISIVATTVDVAGLTLDISTAGTGSGTAAATTAPNANDGVSYLPGTVVGIEATADANSAFTGWTGDTTDIADPASTATTITMNANAAIVANFESTANSYTLTINVDPAASGTATVIASTNPANIDGTYPEGTVLTVRAVAASGFGFGSWTGNVDNTATEVTTITLNQDETITANFVADGCTITGVTPNEAWIFGGVVAVVTGTGLSDGTQISIGGQIVNGFRAAADGSSIEIVIPATTDATANATVLVDVQALCPNSQTSNTLVGGFTYKRHQTDADGVNTTAFIVPDPAATTDVDVTLGGAHDSFAELILPELDVDAGTNVFGIARNALNDTTKQNTAAITALGTAGIDVGSTVDNTLDFTLNLFTASDAKQNTPPAGSAVFPAASAGVFNFGGPIDSEGNPTGDTPALLSAPIDGSGLTVEDFANSVTFWGSAVAYDYVSETATASDPEIVAYQSEILNDEVTPAIVKGTDTPDALMMARLYSLNGFSLRQNAIITADLAEAIRLSNESGTANGDVSGGNTVTIVSRGGGIGHIDRIEMVEVESASKVVGGTITPDNFVTPVGTDEFSLTVTMPASDDAGIVDFVIYGEASPNTPIVTLERVYEYTSEPVIKTPLILLLLGVLLAILGLAAGGDSGGGGGGPCFIATAAYGTPLAAEIDTLRGVRDSYLLDSAVGTAFTDTYYHVSPWIADAVAANPVLASAVRMLLLPVIFIGKIALQAPALALFIMLSIGMMYILRRRARAQG